MSAETWAAIRPDKPGVAATFVARDLIDAQGIGIKRLGRGAKVTVVCDGETVEQGGDTSEATSGVTADSFSFGAGDR